MIPNPLYFNVRSRITKTIEDGTENIYQSIFLDLKV